MKYPALHEVEDASLFELCRWRRFLPSPEDNNQAAIIDLILRCIASKGGQAPAISKAIGWEWLA